ncbi:MAG TPA: YqeG family HAD IIIA-type phosphatase [Firmicutes bacterium]|mgnify:CR=1 FL=1|jgi:HAD superfamily phosphatase (TIGR01668 family)|nr:YqeG family HAD IIIA-type phosphatase [Bacillota bacterium]HHT42462.1 YqeG family HAD IIIA-type phosphatase [Bacillota bacterium]
MRLLVPDVVFSSVLDIDLADLKRRGIEGLLIDIDNTLVPWGDPRMDQAFIDWVESAKEKGFQVCLVSNALPDRAKSFAELLDIPAVGRAMKPLSRAFRRGMKLLGLQPKKVAVVGDQLFTDVFGGNRLGIYTVLVSPLSKTELGATRFMRRLERGVLRKLVQRGLVSSESVRSRLGRE